MKSQNVWPSKTTKPSKNSISRIRKQVTVERNQRIKNYFDKDYKLPGIQTFATFYNWFPECTKRREILSVTTYTTGLNDYSTEATHLFVRLCYIVPHTPLPL